MAHVKSDREVAPFTGAWIEIRSHNSMTKKIDMSLPSRERGLKCNDVYSVLLDSKSLPSRERGLKWNGA